MCIPTCPAQSGIIGTISTQMYSEGRVWTHAVWGIGVLVRGPYWWHDHRNSPHEAWDAKLWRYHSIQL